MVIAIELALWWIRYCLLSPFASNHKQRDWTVHTFCYIKLLLFACFGSLTEFRYHRHFGNHWQSTSRVLFLGIVMWAGKLWVNKDTDRTLPTKAKWYPSPYGSLLPGTKQASEHSWFQKAWHHVAVTTLRTEPCSSSGHSWECCDFPDPVKITLHQGSK